MQTSVSLACLGVCSRWVSPGLFGYDAQPAVSPDGVPVLSRRWLSFGRGCCGARTVCLCCLAGGVGLSKPWCVSLLCVIPVGFPRNVVGLQLWAMREWLRMHMIFLCISIKTSAARSQHLIFHCMYVCSQLIWLWSVCNHAARCSAFFFNAAPARSPSCWLFRCVLRAYTS